MSESNESNIHPGVDEETLSDVIGLCGLTLLENGGETARAEDTVRRICVSQGCEDAQVLAMPTGIFVTFHGSGGRIVTVLRRVSKRTINLNKVHRANSVARRAACGEIGLEQAREELEALNRPSSSSTGYKALLCIIAAVSTAFFTLLYGGDVKDAVASAFCGVIVQLVSMSFRRTPIYHFAMSMFGGMIIGAMAACTDALLGGVNIDAVVIGSITPLLPGLALTNSLRDTMNGDLVSGAARVIEVLMVAFSIACGVGIALSVYIRLGGLT